MSKAIAEYECETAYGTLDRGGGHGCFLIEGFETGDAWGGCRRAIRSAVRDGP